MSSDAHPQVHENASTGFGNRAETYRTARPTYHPALVDRFVERFGDGDVVDLGAGTGIFTRQLFERNVLVTAVEPVAAMRSQLEGDLPGVRALDGTAESMPIDAGSVDTVVVAQAFHWFRHAQAVEEIARVLRPGGALVTVWNVRDPASEMMQRYDEITNVHAGDTPRHSSMIWRNAIDGDPRFDLVDDWHINNPKVIDVDGVIGRALSTSFIASLAPDEQDEVALRLREAITPFGPNVSFGYRCELQAWRLS